MNLGLVLSIYRCLLRLHPPAFRARFGNEMLQVFDDAVETYGWVWLLADLALSLGRQRVLRPEQEVDLAPSSAGLMSGVYADTRPPHLTCSKLGLAVLLSLLSVFLFPPREPSHNRRAEVCHEVTYHR